MAALMMKSASTMTVRPQRASASVKASLKPAVVKAAPMAAPKPSQMMVWQPNNNKFFETFSFLPPLTDDQIAKQVDYVVNNGFVPCLEFAAANNAYVSSENTNRLTNGASALYYDNRYWTMWKLPMFGCKDAVQVLKEVVLCSRAFPDAYVRLIAFDSTRQVQIMSFLVQRPKNARDFQAPNKRSV